MNDYVTRKDFEAWILSHGGSIDRTDGGEYRSAPTDCAWSAWIGSKETERARIAVEENADRLDILRQLRIANSEITRLTECLKKANALAEHFERQWYLRGDEIESLQKDAERFRFANESDDDFAICYWDSSMGNGGEWLCNGYKGNSIDLLDAAIANKKVSPK